MTDREWREMIIKNLTEVDIEYKEVHDIVWIPSYYSPEVGFTYFPSTGRYVIMFFKPIGQEKTYETNSFNDAYKTILRYIFEGVKPNNL